MNQLDKLISGQRRFRNTSVDTFVLYVINLKVIQIASEMTQYAEYALNIHFPVTEL